MADEEASEGQAGERETTRDRDVTLLVIASALVLLASLMIAAQLTPRGAVASLLAVALIAWAIAVTSVGAAGLMLRDLSPMTLLVLAVIWAGMASLTAWRRGRLGGLSSRAIQTFPTLAATFSWPPVAVAAALVVLMLMWRTILALRLPVVDVLGWQYHLVTVDVWLQSNALVRVTQNVWTDGWPAGGELLTTWLTAFTRTDDAAGFTSLLPLPVAIVATTGLARSLGADRRSALLVGLLFGMTPALVALAGTSYVDSAATAAVLAAWWLGLRVVQGERDRSAALLFGIAAGLALGIKGTDLVLVMPILLAVMLTLLADLPAQARSRAPLSDRVARLVLLLAPVLVFGGSWYLKNLLVHGNPFYPIGFGPLSGPVPPGSFGAPPLPAQLAGAGWLEQVARSWTFDWGLGSYSYSVRPGGFGRAWPAILPLAIGGVAVLILRSRPAALALVVAPAAIAFVALTSPWYARYTLFIPALALPLAAVALETFRPLLRSALALALVGLASISFLFANVAPNIALALPREPIARADAYVALVFNGSRAARFDVVLRARCAGFEIIPASARVAVTSRYFLPHAIVGSDLNRVLTAPLTDVPDGGSLVAAMEERRASWLVTVVSTHLDALAAADRARFVPYGRMCSDGNLWRFEPGG